MGIQGRKITVVPFASQQFCENVLACFNKLDYQVMTHEPAKWLQARSSLYSQPCALLFDRSIHMDTYLEPLINKTRFEKTLGIFCCESNIWRPHLVGRLDDYMGWPSHINELAYRVDSLYMNNISETYPDYNAFLSEFIGLNLIGKSEKFLKVLSLIKKIAQTDAAVMIGGETGTGKELAARAIHYIGDRSDGPFIPVNCGAIPENLFESELFGHMRGSFTDAKENQIGLIGLAEGGTLFLDEVDTLTQKGQVSLLRFLQDKKYRPVGAKKHINGNVRIISATNSRLKDLVKDNNFREDLLFRLNLINIVMPPLRERAGDVELLSQHFLDQCQIQYDDSSKYISNSARHDMCFYHWPGNVRELENLVHRAYLLTENNEINDVLDTAQGDRRHHMFDRRIGMFDCENFSEVKSNVVQSFEKNYLQWLLAETKGNVTLAAKKAGKERRALGKLLKKYGIK